MSESEDGKFPGSIIVVDGSRESHEWIPISVMIRPSPGRVNIRMPDEDEVFYCDTDNVLDVSKKPKSDLCVESPFSSASCVFGTHGCEVEHGWSVMGEP